MAAPLYTFTVRDSASIRDSQLRTQRNMLIEAGVPAPNVTPDSDEYIRAQALGNELAVTESNGVVSVDAIMPDTAGDAGLARWGTLLGTAPRGAAGSAGTVIANTTATGIVAAGLLLFDSAGLAYKVSVTGTYANTQPIPITAVSLGEATNHAAGDSLRWQNAPAYFNSNALVGPAGLINGVDAEDTETFRNRLLGMFPAPPRFGNATHVITTTEASTPSVMKAFAYPALQGGATMHVAVVAAPTSTSKNRNVDTITLNGTVIPYVLSAFPEHAQLTITTVTNQTTDVAFGIDIPFPPSATLPGAGGGWLDPTPWPVPFSTATTVTVTSVTSSTVFTVNANAEPQNGGSRIAWISPLTWQLNVATVQQHTGSAGAWVITIDNPFVGLVSGNFVFPQSVNQATYFAAVLAQFAIMGPGEKSSNPSALKRGYRRPTPANSWPYTIGGTMLRALETSSSEVDDTNYFYVSVTTPSLPSIITSPPNQLVPNNLAFYPLVNS